MQSNSQKTRPKNGYSILVEQFTKEKVKTIGRPNVTDRSGNHSILWHWLIFTIIVTFLFAWVLIMGNILSSNNNENQKLPPPDTILKKKLLEFPTAADELEALEENEKIHEESWTAWTAVKNSTQRHICKQDDGVEPSGRDIVLKKFEILKKYSEDMPFVQVDVDYFVPEGYTVSGIIGIDHCVDSPGGYCSIQKINQSGIRVYLMSQKYVDIHFFILVIGRKS